MRVLVIGFTKIAYMPYMHFYINQLQKSNCDISLVCWDRDGKPDIDPPSGVKVFQHADYMLDSEPLAKKVPHFIKYRNYIKKIIKNNKFDLIIVLHSTPGVLLSDILTRKYTGKYILDYRDFTYENFGVYKKIIHKLVHNSIATFVSSKGYLKYLPISNNIFVSHNLLIHSINERNARKNIDRNVEPIRIRFWGFIRHVDVNKLLIDRLGNDLRFELHYHGREQESGQTLKKYVESNRIKNIFFHGEYKPDERINFAARTDLLHNIYENDIKTTYAMGNKYYDGLTFYIPQICNKGSFMGQEVESAGIGIMLDPNKMGFADQIFNYYNTLNWKNFNEKCDDKLRKIVEEYNNGMDVLQDILNGKKV
ncbi:glycosyltransferase [Inediibacterium massiliense]|uniref:glycosyltransferase n=1 Tax=Inediibacterium massiliense TaxID=1658111 RepID=UPI0006B47E64|nr:glycosyltransferase [Inediibacterium massiliense]